MPDITRREALKVLAATAGSLTALAFVPDRWVKPVMGAGFLPAHAQSSLLCPALSMSLTSDLNYCYGIVHIYQPDPSAGFPVKLDIYYDGVLVREDTEITPGEDEDTFEFVIDVPFHGRTMRVEATFLNGCVAVTEAVCPYPGPE